jgi:hypothetical protein
MPRACQTRVTHVESATQRLRSAAIQQYQKSGSSTWPVQSGKRGSHDAQVCMLSLDAFPSDCPHASGKPCRQADAMFGQQSHSGRGKTAGRVTP